MAGKGEMALLPSAPLGSENVLLGLWWYQMWALFFFFFIIIDGYVYVQLPDRFLGLALCFSRFPGSWEARTGNNARGEVPSISK